MIFFDIIDTYKYIFKIVLKKHLHFKHKNAYFTEKCLIKFCDKMVHWKNFLETFTISQENINHQ